MASADNSVQIRVSFSGREHVLPLSVRPSLELPDSKVDAAEDQLNRALRQAFAIQPDATIYLHEAVTNRILSKETFRDPGFCEEFPRHWYLVVEQQQRSLNGKAGVSREVFASDGSREVNALRYHENDLSSMVDDVAKIFGLTESMDDGGGDLEVHQTTATINQHDPTAAHKLMNGPNSYDDDDLADAGFEGYGGYDGDDVMLDGDDVMLPSLAELSLTGDTRYQSHTLHCSPDGEFGFTLRHFSIQPNTRARSETPHSDRTHSRSDSLTSTDSLDSFRLTTTFIHHVTPGGVAEEAGLGAGLAIQQINGESILRSSGDDILQLLDQCGDVLNLLVLPKDNDDLQCLYPHYTYGEAGSHMTDDGMMFTMDIQVTRGTRGPPDRAPVVTNNQMMISSSSNDQSNEDHHQTHNNNNQPPPSSMIRVAPPTGLIPFNDDESQELSLGPDNLHSTNSSGDFLLEASLHEIVMRGEASSAKVNNQSHANYGSRDYENIAPGYTNGEVAHGNRGKAMTKRNNLEFTTTTTASANLDLISEDAPANHMDSKWYHDSNDSYLNSYSNSLAQDPPNKIENTQSSVSDTNFINSASPTEGPRPRTRSQSSLQKASGSSSSSETHLLSGRAGLTSSMSALDYLSLSKRSHSTDLGNIRIKKKGQNSLEALTRIGLQPSSSGGSSTKAIKRHRSDENTHRIKPTPQRTVVQPRETRGAEQSNTPLWMLQSPNAQHRTPRQQSQTSDGGSGSNTQLSGGSSEQQPLPAYRSLAHSQSTEGKGRRARSYQSQRAKLHSRSSAAKISGSQELTDSLEHRIGRGRRSMDRSDTSLEGSTSQDRSVQSDETIVEGKAVEPALPVVKNNQPSPSISLSKEQIQRDAVPMRVSTVGRKHSLREAQQNSLIMRPEREKKNRPLSAVEQQQFRHAALQPEDHTHFQSPPTMMINKSNQFGQGKDSKIPLFKTRSAQTPYGTQVFREVNIEEAIARSQMTQEEAEPDVTVSSEQHGKSDHHHSNHSKRKEFGKKSAKSVDYAVDNESRNIGGSPLALRLSTEVLATLGLGESSEQFRKDIKCHGILSKKLDITESGKRASDRTWRAHYAVLAGTKLLFYKDKRDAVVHKPSEEPSIDVVPSTTTVESSSKKKFVFRIRTAQGAEFLLQADDAPSFSNWVTAIQRLNIGQNVPNDPFSSAMTRPESSNKLAPNSPLMQRRSSSPQPQKTGGKRKEFMNRLRRALTGQRPGDQPDSSSFLTFGQSLEDCPVSADNKRVPLVVEFCVREVEEHGLEVEGIYRKPGQVNLIKSMSAEMDKGNYEFSEYGDIHTVGSLLKKFFKELPDPAVPAHLYDDFVACAKEINEEERLSSLKELVFQLPTAHYHTLKFLMRHLKKVASRSDENKMTYRNVSIVFGPTLLFKPDASQDVLSNMNASYVIVQLLCQHVEHLFSSELCGEEQRLQEEATEMMRLRDEEIATRGSPTISRHSETKMQKEKRLAKASPQAVRRIKNNLGSNERVSNGRLSHSEAKRNSLIEGSTTLQPKQPNWASQPRSSARRISDEYHGSGVGMSNSRQLHPQQQERRQKMKKTHVYEDVESPEPQLPMIRVSADSHARTRSWVESHNERMWAGEDVERSDSAEGHRRGEGHRHGDVAVGSLWASRNRPEVGGQHQTRGAHPSSSSSKERRQHPRMSRLGERRHLPTAYAPPPMTVESELLGSSYSRAASLPTSHVTAGLAGSNSRRISPGTPTGHQGLGSKKISYGIAVGISPVDMPDKDMPHHHGGRGRRDMERAERFSSSEHFTSSTMGHARSRSRDGGEQGWQGTDAGYGSSSRSSHAHHQGQGHTHHTGMYPRQFNSLQRQLSPPQAQPQHHYSSSRRSSESSRDSYGGSYILQENHDHYSHYSGGTSRGGRNVPQRAYSNDVPHGQRVDGVGPNPIPNRESYL